MKKIFTILSVLLLSSISAFAQDKEPGTYDLTAEDFQTWSAADKTGIATGAAGGAFDLNNSTGLPYGDGSVGYLNYADLSNASTLVVVATEGIPRLLFNRTVNEGAMGYEYPKSDTYTTVVDNGDGSKTYTTDIAALVHAQGFAHLHAIKGANWANTTVTSIQYVIPKSEVKIYDPIIIKTEKGVTPLTALTGYTDNDQWVNSITFPKIFQSQGQVFGNGDGSNESEHVDISDYDKITFDVKSGSNNTLGLRVWLWDETNKKVVTLFAHPEADYKTADFNAQYDINEPGLYSVNISEYKYLKGVKATNLWAGQTPIIVENAFVSKGETSLVAIDEAMTFSSSEIVDFSEVTDVKAYMVTACLGDKVNLKRVTGAVPANTGLILVPTVEKSVYTLPTCGEATEDVTWNMLVATTEETTVPSESYVLAGKGEELGWYQIPSNAEGPTLAAGKAYLTVTGYGAKLQMSFDEDEATAISTPAVKAVKDNAYYTLQGVRVANPTKGIYINNGKKVFINK